MKKTFKTFVSITLVLSLILASNISVASAATRPAKPVLTVQNMNNDSILLDWNNVKGATKYYIYCAVDGGKYFKMTTTKKSYYRDYDVDWNTTYHYKVKAVDKNGNTSYYSSPKSTIIFNNGRCYSEKFGVPNFGTFCDVPLEDSINGRYAQFSYLNSDILEQYDDVNDAIQSYEKILNNYGYKFSNWLYTRDSENELAVYIYYKRDWDSHQVLIGIYNDFVIITI